MSPAELLATEHQRGLHTLFQPRSCAECQPGQDQSSAAASLPAPRSEEAEEAAEPTTPPASARRRAGGMQTLSEAIERVTRPRSRPDTPLVETETEPLVAFDGGPWCAQCRGTRWVRREDLRVSDAGFGAAVSCPGCFETFVLPRRLEKLLGELPELFRDWTLESFPSFDPRQRQLLELARTWLDDPSLPWLFAHGETGRGKTGLAVGLLAAAIRRRRTGTFKRSGPLLQRIRRTYRSREAYDADETDLLEALYAVDLLVLDDLGTELTTDWAAEKLFDVIGGRHDRKRQTIITSNFSLPELEERIGSPTVSRIEELAGRYVIDCSRLPYLRDSRSIPQ